MNDLFSNSLFSNQQDEQANDKPVIDAKNTDSTTSGSFADLLNSVDMSEETFPTEEENPFDQEMSDQDFVPYNNNQETTSYKLDPNFLDRMNPEQKEAVLYDEGSLLVLAGAGSGKTRVITHRFAHLIQKYDLRIYNILCVTFTNKAAGEMKERIGHLLGVNTRTAWVRTFHSMCAMILREHALKIGFSQDFTIYDSGDTKNTIKKIMERLKIDPKEHSDKMIARVISSSKEELISPQELERSARGEFDHLCAEVYKEYQQTLKQNHAMDFGDLITNTIVLLEQCSDVRERYQRQWRYIMADEFQDTNKPQYHLLSLLSRDRSNVCVVGDDDQSIYAWRGAKVANIRQFHQEFKAHIVKLERNYRSYGNILLAANSIVKSIKGRMPKVLKAERAEGDKIIFNCLGDDRIQAAYIYEEIRKHVEQGKSYKDFAILYRTNAQSRVLEEVMTRHNVPHRIYGGQRFFDRAEIKDILSYLRIMVNPYDVEAFERSVNVPKRKVGNVGKQKIRAYVENNKISYPMACLNAESIEGLTKQASYKLVELGKIITELKESIETLPPTQIIKILVESIRYFEDYLVPEYGPHEAEDRFDNIQELVNAIKVFEQANPQASIADFLREASLLSSINEEDVDENNTVTLMTIHSSKGLEFPIVFVAGLAEGVLPLTSATTQEAEDEEKRLLYVAITRAMNKLYLTYEERALRYGEFVHNEKSHFLDAIPTEILDDVTESFSSNKKDTYRKTNESYKDHYSKPKTGYSKYSKYSAKTTSSTNCKADTSSVQDVLGSENSSIKTEKITSVSELEVGQEVMHSVFGKGTVEYSSSAMVRVAFDRFGTQVLMGSTVLNLKKIVE